MPLHRENGQRQEQVQVKAGIDLFTLTVSRPQEISSKQPVSVLRDSNLPKKPVNLTKIVPSYDLIFSQKYHDPRFDRAMGSFNEDLFQKSFEFVKDLQHKEIKELEIAVRNEKDFGRKESLQKTLQRIVP